MALPRPPFRKPRAPVAPRVSKSGHVSPPVAGFNSTDAATSLPGNKGVYLYNVIPGENGLRPRGGSDEQATLLGGEPVRTMLSFRSHDPETYPDKLFAVTISGIFDVTTSAEDVEVMQEWPIASGLAGYCVAQNFNNGEESFLLLTDEANGYWVYTASTNSWQQIVGGTGPGEIDGAAPEEFAFVTVWKNRVWFVKRKSGQAYYLPVGQYAGTVGAFAFGNKFSSGGELIGLWPCTQDGGVGVDDYLVAAGTGGDVLVYQGTDPSDASKFENKGSWNVGAFPPGRRVVSGFGGDVLLLSTLGALPLSKLMRGSTITDPDLYTTKDVSNLFTRLMDERRSEYGWSICLHPRDNVALVLVPTLLGEEPQQLAMSFATRGWYRWRKLDMVSAVGHDGDLYFGTSDGRVVENSGDVDNARINPAVAPPEGIPFSGLTSFQTFNNGHLKRGQTVRPMLVCSGPPPNILVEARYDFDLTEVISDPPPEVAADGVLTWDESNFDECVFGGTFINRSPIGLTGMGTAIALAFRGLSYGRFSLVGFNVTWDEGGPT